MARQTRSQRPREPSQPQAPRATQGGRSRRGRVDEELEEDYEENKNAYGDDNADDKGPNDIERKARDLVRLALFHEQRRIPLRRDEISKKALGSSSRAFNAVFESANSILRKTFAMQLVELQSMPSDIDISEKDADLLKNTGVKKKAAASGTKTYMLRSTLDPAIIESACSPDAEIRELEQKENADENEEFAQDDNLIGTHSTGSIFAWHNADQLASVGILYTILGLILVEGRVISDGDLRAILKRLQLSPNVPIPLSNQATNLSITIDTYLTQLMRQGYLDKVRVGNAGGKGGAKRPRATQAAAAAADDSSLQAFEWRWGPRALTEVGERAIAQFVAEFMAGQPGQEEDDEEDAVAASQDEGTRKRVENLYKGIERAAAGGELLELEVR